MALLTAYFDESGIHAGDHRCVVAGFVGNDAQWHSFIKDWVDAILPRKNLHMKELPWSRHPERIPPLLEKLGPIPHKYNLRPVQVSVVWSDFISVVKGKVSQKFINPYMLCAVCCMSVVFAEMAGTDDVYFLFDRQEGLRKEAMEAIRTFSFEVAGVDSRFKGADFIRGTNTVCLDPADYLAYIVREHGIDSESFKFKSGISILGTKGVYGGKMARDDLAAMVEWWQQDHTPKEILANLSKNPFFRGPR
jgi:hypothetical protein